MLFIPITDPGLASRPLTFYQTVWDWGACGLGSLAMKEKVRPRIVYSKPMDLAFFNYISFLIFWNVSRWTLVNSLLKTMLNWALLGLRTRYLEMSREQPYDTTPDSFFGHINNCICDLNMRWSLIIKVTSPKEHSNRGVSNESVPRDRQLQQIYYKRWQTPGKNRLSSLSLSCYYCFLKIILLTLYWLKHQSYFLPVRSNKLFC